VTVSLARYHRQRKGFNRTTAGPGIVGQSIQPQLERKSGLRFNTISTFTGLKAPKSFGQSS